MRHLLPICILTSMACGSPEPTPPPPPPERAAPPPEAPDAPSRRGKAKARPEAPPPPPAEGDVTVKVLPGGGFDPPVVSVRPGATVTWVLHEPRRDSLAPLRSDGDGCDAVAPWTPGDLTGPMHEAPGGLYVLNTDGPGFQPRDDGTLASTGPVGAVMDASWESPAFSGAFLRFRWSTVQPTPDRYDWSLLDTQMEKAVAEGKQFSLAIKAGYHGTPEWIFDAGVDKLVFRDFGSGDNATACKCGAFMALGNPTQERYQELYFAMLDALAEHLKSNAAWYRHLSYIKPSGANLYSGENRLPKRCDCAEQCTGEDQVCKVPKEWKNAPNLTPDGRICNTEVWAKAGYTPEGLYGFFRKQHARLAKAYPEKAMMYMLIQDGFPRVGGPDAWLGCGEAKRVKGIPDGNVQTRTILRQGWEDHGKRFSLMHAGLNDVRDPNRMLQDELKPGQPAALQTTNDVLDAARLGRVLDHALEHRQVNLVEVYEEAAWQAMRQGERFADYDARLRANGTTDVPAHHRHTFAAQGTFRYVNPHRCDDANDIGVVHVVR